METQERISIKSHELFMLYGIRSVSMDEIANHLGMSKKTIYQYFKDKDALVEGVIDIEIQKLLVRIKTLDFELELTQESKDYISEKGYDPEYGARPLKRAIQKYIEDPITEEIIKSNPKKGSKMILDYDKENDQMVVTFSKEKKSKKKL